MISYLHLTISWNGLKKIQMLRGIKGENLKILLVRITICS